MADTTHVPVTAGSYSLIAENTSNILIKTRGAVTTAKIVLSPVEPDVETTDFMKLSASDFPFPLFNIKSGNKVWLMPEKSGGIEVISGREASTEDDDSMVAGGAITNANAGTWQEMMAADPARNGAVIQSKAQTGSIFIMMLDDGLPADGSHLGEIEIPQRPSYYAFDFKPRRRYVVRGENASMPFTLNWW